MSKKVLLDAFYTQFSQFISELSRAFPEDTDFPTYSAQLMLLKRVNPNLVIKEMMTHLLPVKEIIRARDADYFLGGTPPATLVELVSSESIDPVLNKLRSYWKQMTPENQSVVWSYMNLLIEIAERYSN